MQFVLEGILAGLGLAILLGPIFIALTQTSIERGFKAGIVLGTGVWISDLIIILLSFVFINSLDTVIQGERFNYWMGLIGGAVFIMFGIGSFFSKIDLDYKAVRATAKSYIVFFMKGFLVNTVNPFTFIFWIGIISTYVIGRQCTNQQSTIFLCSIFATIILTDSLKVLIAKMIRKKLKQKQITWFSRIAGLGLLGFGVFLILQSI